MFITIANFNDDQFWGYLASESNGDSEEESQEQDDEDIQEEGEESGSDRVLRLLQGMKIFCS